VLLQAHRTDPPLPRRPTVSSKSRRNRPRRSSRMTAGVSPGLAQSRRLDLRTERTPLAQARATPTERPSAGNAPQARVTFRHILPRSAAGGDVMRLPAARYRPEPGPAGGLRRPLGTLGRGKSISECHCGPSARTFPRYGERVVWRPDQVSRWPVCRWRWPSGRRNGFFRARKAIRFPDFRAGVAVRCQEKLAWDDPARLRLRLSIDAPRGFG